MEVAETVTRHSLPSINHLDIDRIKREENDYQKKQDTHGSGTMANNIYSPGFQRLPPPPPYQQSPSSHGPASLSALISPPEPRRAPEQEKDQKSARLSLPSIHEALNAEQRYPPPPSQSQPSGPPSGQFSQPPVPSPSDASHRPFNPELQKTGPAYPSATPTAYSKPTPTTPAAPPNGPLDALPRPTFSSSNPSKFPTLHPIKTHQSPVEAPSASYPPPPYHQSAAPEHGSHSAGPSAYGYASASQTPSYPYSAPPQNQPTGYPQTPAYSAPPRYGTSWTSDEVNHVEESKRNGRYPGPTYGESVKRHLDNFDLEASLNEIAEGSGRLLEFTHLYGQRAHQSQRSGSFPGSIPAMSEVEELILQNQKINESLQRIQGVIQNQQNAMEEKAQEERLKAMNGFPGANQNHYADEQKGAGGFAGADPKKRRGRAAPPGRCHSCNRAETPEWRRGPDGARTLCNACGLHYAKLTRKMGTGKAAVGSTNLRPKSMGPGSPAA